MWLVVKNAQVVRSGEMAELACYEIERNNTIEKREKSLEIHLVSTDKCCQESSLRREQPPMSSATGK